MDLWFHRKERPSRSVSTGKREPQAGPASGLSDSASKRSSASGEDVLLSETETDPSVNGKDGEGLPGSESVARAEGNTRNEGDPKSPCRTNYEGQAGREAQPKGVPPGDSGVGLANSSQRQGASPEAGEGANRSTQSAQATRTVRTTEQDWQTFLRAIAEKAYTDKHHRFGDLYRWLNQDVLRLCFFQLRKDAASGVDGVTFQEYEQHLEANLQNLVERLKRKAYRARLVRRKYIPKGNGKLRPLGIPVLEDKLLQMAVTQILLAIYEVDFLPCSYGYRPGMSAHHAIKDCRTLYKWLNRRSQRRSLTWPALNQLLVRFQVPPPRIVEKNGHRMPCQRELSFCQRLVDFPLRNRFPKAHARASRSEEPGAGKPPAGICEGAPGNRCPYLEKRKGTEC